MSKSKNITLNVEGMTCNNCALGVTKKLEKMGLQQVNTSFATGEVSFTPNTKISIENVANAINGLGFKVVDDPDQHQGLSAIEKKFYFSLIFTIPLFLHMFFPHSAWINHPIVQVVLCTPVFLLGCWHFGRSALGGLKSGVANMDVLIFIGSTAAFGYSLAGTIMHYNTDAAHNYMFFETTATIITLVLLGNVLEHRSVNQTTTAIKELTQLQQTHAHRVTTIDGTEKIEDIDAGDVKLNDTLLINTGDQVPTDGTIISGEATLDEAMISGESIPVHKQQGDEVIGGTILLEGSIRIQVTRIGSDTVLAKIIALVKTAQQDKPPIQQLGDKVSSIFVPTVLGLSALTFALSYWVFDLALQNALMHSIAVLVISCPCAMGLATPTAVIAGIGRAAKKGILIKGGSTLEEFANVQTVVFDKTGTLTTGQFQLQQLEVLEGKDEQWVRQLIYSIEQHSAHPIARSLVKALDGTPLIALENISEIKGKGLQATSDGNTYLLGSDKLATTNVESNPNQLLLFENNTLIAKITVEDEVKPGAKALMDALHREGKTTVMLSGDRKEKCEKLAQELGIATVHAEKLPEEKLAIIEQLSANSKTAMIGDGINDAPALAKAHVGLSLGDATQVAIHSAQIVLLNGKDLNAVTAALLVSKHTLKTIKQNLFWAFFYNVVAIPVAAVGLLNPMVAALAMAFSDVIVIGNSIRLKTKKLT